MRAPTDHHHGRTCDHDHGGTTIIYDLDDDGSLVVYDSLHRAINDEPLGADDRRAALEHLAGVINAELGDVPAGELPAGRRVPPDGDDAGQPDTAAVLAAVCRWLTGSVEHDGSWDIIWAAAGHRPHD